MYGDLERGTGARSGIENPVYGNPEAEGLYDEPAVTFSSLNEVSYS